MKEEKKRRERMKEREETCRKVMSPQFSMAPSNQSHTHPLTSSHTILAHAHSHPHTLIILSLSPSPPSLSLPPTPPLSPLSPLNPHQLQSREWPQGLTCQWRKGYQRAIQRTPKSFLPRSWQKDPALNIQVESKRSHFEAEIPCGVRMSVGVLSEERITFE